MAQDPGSRNRINMKNTRVLLVESNSMGMDILVQILVGFGVKSIYKADDIDMAKRMIESTELDLMVVSGALGEADGCELVEWLRREAPVPNRYAPALLVTAHTQLSRVARARDCGAHIVVAKPLTPMILLERILWIARVKRSFISTKGYNGPDRRFKFTGPPNGMDGRRADDLDVDIGEPVAPNMSQDQIDALMQPQKVVI
ncbi:response regulator [Caulobacter sp. NIBR1757]|uniref:response regulator n=1 Tax=Caulobacter sp. NIBR1757 TaxID=3016000 RepID=UPI0022F0B6EF|nr:response regulator [Caulobacter sp. NIBR1757]